MSFNPNIIISNKSFSQSVVIVVVLVLISSYVVYLLDPKIRNSSNNVIRHYQENKIDLFKTKNIETIVIGGSSGGNGIDAKFFSKLSHKETLNLSLTISYGIESSLNMIIKAKKAFPKLKNIIIIFDPFLWGRDFSYQGYIDTVPSIVDMIFVNTFI